MLVEMRFCKVIHSICLNETNVHKLEENSAETCRLRNYMSYLVSWVLHISWKFVHRSITLNAVRWEDCYGRLSSNKYLLSIL